MDMLTELGELALGTRLKRLSERLMQDVNRIYAHYKIPFESRWFAVFYLVSKGRALTIMDMAEKTGLTHPAIIQSVTEMSKAGLVLTTQDKDDKRKRLVELTPDGKKMFTKLTPVWERIRLANQAILKELGLELLEDIKAIEGALTRQDLFTRVCGSVRPSEEEISILGFRSAYRDAFRDLNYEWLKKYFTIEPQDRKLLTNPETEIIGKGGFVFVARYKKNLVGTCALIKLPDESFELTKMAVTESAQGLGIGKKLAQHALTHARKKGARTVILETNPKLESAISLYRKLGFREVKGENSSKYTRSTFFMKLEIK